MADAPETPVARAYARLEGVMEDYAQATNQSLIEDVRMHVRVEADEEGEATFTAMTFFGQTLIQDVQRCATRAPGRGE